MTPPSATLSALDFIQAWLQVRGGGCAAVIAAERWSHTVDFADVGMSGIWAYGDSGVVGLQQLRDEGHLDAPVLVGSSTSYAFGTGMLLPPRK